METQRDWEQGAPKETGSRGLRGQTDACGCSGAELGGGASTRRWTLVRHKKGLSGYLYHPILGGLPYSAILPHSGWLELQDTCSGPWGPIRGFLLWEQEEPHQQSSCRQKSWRKGKVAFPRHCIQVESIICGTREMLTPWLQCRKHWPSNSAHWLHPLFVPSKPPSVNRADKWVPERLDVRLWMQSTDTRNAGLSSPRHVFTRALSPTLSNMTPGIPTMSSKARQKVWWAQAHQQTIPVHQWKARVLTLSVAGWQLLWLLQSLPKC